MASKILIIKSSAVSPIYVQLKHNLTHPDWFLGSRDSKKLHEKILDFFLQTGSRAQLEVVWNPISIGFIQIRRPSRRILKCLLCLVAARHTTRAESRVRRRLQNHRTIRGQHGEQLSDRPAEINILHWDLTAWLTEQDAQYGFSSADALTENYQL